MLWKQESCVLFTFVSWRLDWIAIDLRNLSDGNDRRFDWCDTMLSKRRWDTSWQKLCGRERQSCKIRPDTKWLQATLTGILGQTPSSVHSKEQSKAWWTALSWRDLQRWSWLEKMPVMTSWSVDQQSKREKQLHRSSRRLNWMQLDRYVVRLVCHAKSSW